MVAPQRPQRDKEKKKERQRETERKKERDRQRERQIDREREKEREKIRTAAVFPGKAQYNPKEILRYEQTDEQTSFYFFIDMQI